MKVLMANSYLQWLSVSSKIKFSPLYLTAL